MKRKQLKFVVGSLIIILTLSYLAYSGYQESKTYFRTVPLPERTQVLGEIIRHQAEAVAPLGLYYNPRPGGAAHRMTNVGDEWPAVYMVWNAHEWDVLS